MFKIIVIIATSILFSLINAMEKDMEYNYLDNIPDELKIIIAEKLADDPSPERAGANLRALRSTNAHWKNFIDVNTRNLIHYRIRQYYATKILTSLYVGTPIALDYCKKHLKKVHEKDNKAKILDRILRGALNTYSGSKQTNIIIYNLVKHDAQLITPNKARSYLIESNAEPQDEGCNFRYLFLINFYKRDDDTIIEFGTEYHGYYHKDPYDFVLFHEIPATIHSPTTTHSAQVINRELYCSKNSIPVCYSRDQELKTK